MADELVLRWRTDITQLERGLRAVEQRVSGTAAAISRLGGGGETGSALANSLSAASDRARQLLQHLERINAARAQLARSGGQTTNITRESGLAEVFGRQGAVGTRQLADAAGAVKAEILSITSGMRELAASANLEPAVKAFEELGAAMRQASRAALQRGDVEEFQRLTALGGRSGDILGTQALERLNRALKTEAPDTVLKRLAQEAANFGGALGESIRENLSGIDKLVTRAQNLQRVLDQIAAGPGEIPGLGKVGSQSRFTPTPGTDLAQELGGRVGPAAINRLMDDTRESIRAASAEFNSMAEAGRRAAQEIVGSGFERIPAILNTAAGISQRAESILSGDSINAAIRERLSLLEREKNLIVEQQAAVQRLAISQTGRRNATQLAGQLADFANREASAQARVNSIVRQRIALERELAQSTSARVRDAVQQARADIAAGRAPTFKTAGLSDDDVRRQERFVSLMKEEVDAKRTLAQVQADAQAPRAALQGALEITGLSGEAERLDAALAGVVSQIQALSGDDALAALGKTLGPEFTRMFEDLVKVRQRLSEDRQQSNFAKQLGEEARAAKLTAVEVENLERSQRTLVEGLERMLSEAVGSAGMGQTMQGLAEEIAAGLGPIERGLIDTFSNMGNRFRATFQFALSGAILYGLQNFAREAFDTAVEVERAFADITAAVEVHRIDLSRWEVERQVEGVRRSILEIANDLNVLPTEANKAGYQMVARFNDVGNAMKALRAQLLATKVSTIEQSEVLRALTATAETFAGAMLEAASGLNLTQRLMEREAVAADLYGEALDAATRVQQRFGISVEDVLEGTARGSEVFRQTGFTMEETVAIVSAASLRLGQTGAQVAERFGRAFGGLTPEIIEELVTFAARTEGLDLTYADFSNSIADGLFKIQAQISNLNTRELQQLINIVGQRRETDVVAAFFGSGDLQNTIISDLDNAAGAAEQRFSILARTTAELFESVKVQLAELAQNMERLGALSPLRVFLETLDRVLSAINAITKAAQTMFEALNAIPLAGGLGNLIIQLTSLGAAIGVLGRLGLAVGRLQPYFGALALAGGGGGAKRMAGGAAQLVLPGIAAQAAAQATAARASGLLSTALVGAAKGVAGFGLLLTHPVQTIKNLTNSMRTAETGLFAFAAQLRIAIAEQVRKNVIDRIQNLEGPVGQVLQRRLLTTTTDATTGAAVTTLSKGALVAAGAVGALGVATLSVVGALRNAAAAQEEYNKQLQSEEGLARREIRAQGLEGVDAEIRLIEGQIAATQAAMSGAVDGFGGFINSMLLDIRTGFDSALREEINRPERQELARAMALGISGFGADPDRITNEFLEPTTDRGFQVSLELLMRRQFELLQAQFHEAANEALAKLSPEQRTQFRGTIGPRGTLDQLSKELFDVMALPEQTPETLARAQALRDEIQGVWEGILFEIGAITEETAAEFEGSLTLLQERLDGIQFDREVGKIDSGEFTNQMGNLLGDTQRLLASLTDPEQMAKTTEFLRNVFTNLRGAYEAGIQEELVSVERIKDADDRLRAKIGVLQGAVALFQRLFGDNVSGLVAGWMEEIRQAQEELIDRAREEMLGDARHQVGIARNTDSKLQSMRELLVKLIGQNVEAIMANNQDLARELAQEIDRLMLDIATTESDQVRTGTVASIRLSGPILSRLTSIKAEIAGIQHDINAGFLSHNEILEAQVRLNELLAQRVQEQARAAAAYLRIQAGTRNEMRNLQAELTILAKEMEIAAVQYGKNEAAYLELALRHQQAKDAIVDAQLRLNDLNRRLAGTVDVTNPFADAQLELMRIMEALAQEGLGELEKAQLELEKRRAEANALRQFYSDRLFQLQFDFETGAIGEDAYVAALKRLQETVDTSTRQGKEIWLEIEGLINGMVEDVSDMSFNIPSAIRLPTIFEVRRALAADQLGVNYMDNRQVNVTVDVSSVVDLESVLNAIDDAFGDASAYQFRRSPAGGAAIYAGGF